MVSTRKMQSHVNVNDRVAAIDWSFVVGGVR